MMLLREESFRTFEDDDCLIMAHFTKSAKKLRKPIDQNQKIVTALTMDKLMNTIIIN